MKWLLLSQACGRWCGRNRIVSPGSYLLKMDKPCEGKRQINTREMTENNTCRPLNNHKLVHPKTIVLQYLIQELEKKKKELEGKASGAWLPGENVTWAVLGGILSCDVLTVTPSTICSFSRSLMRREPLGEKRNVSSKVSSKNIITQPILCICWPQDHETRCPGCFEGHVHHAVHIPPPPNPYPPSKLLLDLNFNSDRSAHWNPSSALR